jgi:threonine/homoserine/homoserine lactone efflux protein
MFDVNTLSLFISASVLLALAPGPDNIFVLTQSAVKGWLVGLIVTLGLCTGLIVHTVAVAFGVAAIFQASELAFTVLKLAGAAYLLYLAYKSLRAGSTTIETENTEGVRLSSFYLRGIIMNVTNPKVSIFFLAFLPQFADPAKGSLPFQMISLGAIFMVVTLVVFGLISLLAGVIGTRFRKSARMQILLNRVAGVVFIGLALKLATSNR